VISFAISAKIHTIESDLSTPKNTVQRAMPSKLKIKGIRDGLLITLPDGEWADVETQLLAHVREQAEFLSGASLSIDVGNQIIHAAKLGKLRDQLADMGVSLRAVLSNSPKTESTAQALGLATRISKPHPERVVRAQRQQRENSTQNAIVVERTLRSGVNIQHHGHVIIMGDVNPGAEVIAGGNVIVWGRLRGMVHAGAEGNENAYVCALVFEPTQLRIADQIAIPPKKKWKSQPEIGLLKEGQVIVQKWDTKK